MHHAPAGKIPLDWFLYMKEIQTSDLAKQVGVHPSQMSRYRKGLIPPEDKRKLIARKLKVSLADLGWEEVGAGV